MKQISGNYNGDPAGKTVELVVDNGARFPVELSGGRWTVLMPDGVPSPFGAGLEMDGHRVTWLTIPPPGAWEANLPPVSMTPPSLSFATAVQPAAQLTIVGRDFQLNGERWVWRGASDFRMLQWIIEGRDMSGVLAQRVAAGANILRVFGMYNGGIGRFIPDEYGENYWGGLSVLCQQAAKAGLHVELTMFADCQTFLSGQRQQDYWNRLSGEAPNQSNLLVELGNEWRKNGFDPAKFSPIPGVLCSQGSGLSDEAGPLPGWSYHTWHGRRDWPKVVAAAEDMFFVGEGCDSSGNYTRPQKPAVHDEPIGFADSDVAGKRSADPFLARATAQTSSAFGAGATFHSDAGIQSQLWSPHVEGLAKIFYAACR